MRLRKKLSSSREKTKKHDISEFINLRTMCKKLYEYFRICLE